MKDRQKLAAQLGAALYERLKSDSDARKGLEQLFDSIAAIDVQRSQIQGELNALEAEAAASAAAVATYRCPGCGMTIKANDMFCSGCGKPADEIRAQAHAAVAQAGDAVGQPPAPMAQSARAAQAQAPMSQTGDAATRGQVQMAQSAGAAAQARPMTTQAAGAGGQAAGIGRSVSAASANHTCPKCGSSYAEGDKFCMSCGMPIAPRE